MKVELKNKDGVWKLRLMLRLWVNVHLWPLFSTNDVISQEVSIVVKKMTLL